MLPCSIKLPLHLHTAGVHLAALYGFKLVQGGLGGIFVEVLKDVSSGLAPLSYAEAESMIHSLRAYKIIEGTRGQKGINQKRYAEIIVRLSTLLRFAIEIKEMDINPLLADENDVVAVDARILVEK